MAGRTHGGRSPVTCHLRCGDACFQPVPNTTDNEHFRDVASRALSRRAVVGGGVAGALALVLTPAGGAAATSTTADAAKVGGTVTGAGRGLSFTPIAPVPATVDAVTVPDGYRWDAIIRWGDPVLQGGRPFDVHRQTAEQQSRQFGYNNDYVDVLPLDGERGRRAVLVANHEYTNENLMFPPTDDAAELEERKRIAMAAHGMSVVELRRRGPGYPWEYQRHGHLNRRVTASTPFAFSGPAAGSPLLRTADDPEGRTALGTVNNCAGGTTPWGTVLSGEENVNQYFRAPASPENSRYGLGERPTSRGWETVDPRFDARTPGYQNEPNRFGWVVELDPMDPTSTPVKHTALGRFKHEGATVRVAADGRVVAYMGDDERFDYVYKFVSRDRMRTGSSRRDREHNKQLLAAGDLYVARFTGDGSEDGVHDGTGEWIPLVRDGRSQVPGFSVERVLVHTRLAADAVGATKMDRPEDVQANPVTGAVYVACTNNSQRGAPGRPGADEANPRTPNKDGHVVEILEDGGDAAATTFTWNLFLVCGDADSAGTYFGGWTGPVAPISCPDNVAFDSEGNLWVSTDGQPGSIGLDDALFKVPVTGPERGHVQQFLAVPTDAETCGPVVDDRDGVVYVAVQHPGEDGSWEQPRSYFPDYLEPGTPPRPGLFAGPRPSVVQVYRPRR
ncbi:PhoX family protein [Thalassiella azotivora]